MTFKTPPKILQKILRFKAFKFKDGKLILWDVPGILSPIYVTVYLQTLLEKDLGKRKAMEIIYGLGKFQGLQGLKMCNERFGYAITIKNKKELLDFISSQSEVTGLGKFKWIVTDFNKRIFVVRGKCSIGEEYKRFFGFQKEPVDHFTRGQAAAMVEGILGSKCISYEIKCTAMGNPYCEFIVRPLEDINKINPLFRKQISNEILDFKGLGAKVNPYLALP